MIQYTLRDVFILDVARGGSCDLQGNFVRESAEFFGTTDKIGLAIDLTITPTRPPPWLYNSTTPSEATRSARLLAAASPFRAGNRVLYRNRYLNLQRGAAVQHAGTGSFAQFLDIFVVIAIFIYDPLFRI
jgi:hypothetical protein